MFKLPKPRLRFSLRTLLALVTLIGIYLAVLTHRAVRQRSVIAFVHQYDHGYIGYEPRTQDIHVPGWLRRALGDDYFVNVTEVHLHAGITSKNFPAVIEQLAALPTLHTVYLRYAEITDDDLRHLTKLRQITLLGLPESATDKGLNHLISMDNLRELDTSHSSVSSAGLSYMPRFRSLKALSVGCVDEQGLPFLAECKELENLTLNNCHCGGPGLKAIVRIPNLKGLTFLNMAAEPVESEVTADNFEQMLDKGHIRYGSYRMVERIFATTGLSKSSFDHALLDDWLKKRRPGLEVWRMTINP